MCRGRATADRTTVCANTVAAAAIPDRHTFPAQSRGRFRVQKSYSKGVALATKTNAREAVKCATLIATIPRVDCFCYISSIRIAKDFVRRIRSMPWQSMGRLATPAPGQGVIPFGICDTLDEWNCFLFPGTFTKSSEVRVGLHSMGWFEDERTVGVPAGFGSDCALNVVIAGPRYLWAAPTPNRMKAGFGKGPPLGLIY